MRKTRTAITTIGGALCALLFVSGAQAQSLPDVNGAPPGASSCLGCHGAQPTAMPSISNLTPAEIETAMEQFRSGAREATLMNRIAKGFTPEESKAIAAWLGAKK
jgi:sulfide dehydrogenase cytochrome subunit